MAGAGELYSGASLHTLAVPTKTKQEWTRTVTHRAAIFRASGDRVATRPGCQEQREHTDFRQLEAPHGQKETD